MKKEISKYLTLTSSLLLLAACQANPESSSSFGQNVNKTSQNSTSESETASSQTGRSQNTQTANSSSETSQTSSDTNQSNNLTEHANSSSSNSETKTSNSKAKTETAVSTSQSTNKNENASNSSSNSETKTSSSEAKTETAVSTSQSTNKNEKNASNSSSNSETKTSSSEAKTETAVSTSQSTNKNENASNSSSNSETKTSSSEAKTDASSSSSSTNKDANKTTESSNKTEQTSNPSKTSETNKSEAKTETSESSSQTDQSSSNIAENTNNSQTTANTSEPNYDSLYADTLSKVAADDNPVTQYAFYDIDNNGTKELITGKVDSSGKPFLLAVYYLKNGVSTYLAHTETAPVGGYRSGFAIYTDGRITFSQVSSHNGKGSTKTYRLAPDNSDLILESEEDIQVGVNMGSQTGETLDGSTFDWKNLADFSTQANTETQPSTPSKEVETVPATNLPQIDLDALKNNDFSSVAGTWTGPKGTVTLTADGKLTDSTGRVVTLTYAITSDRGLLLFNPNGSTGGDNVYAIVPKGVELRGTDSNQVRLNLPTGTMNPFAPLDVYYQTSATEVNAS